MRRFRAMIRAGLLAALLVWLIVPPGPVQAHANLISSNPSAGQALPRFPTQAQFQFSEAVNPANPRLTLYNSSGLAVAQGTAERSPADPSVLDVTFPALPDGVYSIAWQVQSAMDGHITSGTVAFSVGLNTPKASLLPPPGTPDPARDLPYAAEVAWRWLGYLAASLAAGAALFGVSIWRPAYRATRRASGPLTQWDTRLGTWLRGLVLAGAGGIAFSLVGVASEAATRTGGPQALPYLTRAWQALAHNGPAILAVQAIVLLGMVILAMRMDSPGEGSTARWWGIVALGGAILATFSLASHDSSTPITLASPTTMTGDLSPLVLVDWLHLAGMAAWTGGLLPLSLLLGWQRGPSGADLGETAARAARRFSRMALISVAVIGASGLVSALVQIQTLEALTATRYGQAVLLKSALFAALIGLGALNQFRLLPRLPAPRSALRLLQNVRVEYALALGVLLAAGGLMSLPPGRQALAADYRQGSHEVYSEGGVRLDFRVAPAQVGDNELGVDASDARPGAGAVQPTVLLRIQSEDSSSTQAQTQVEARPDSPGRWDSGRWTARGSYFSQMGVWDVEVIWRKPGFDDVTHVFSVDLAKIAAGRGEKVNPAPADAASIAAGSRLYQANCAPCHGPTGKGDGPAGQSLVPPPADLTLHVVPGVHTDGQLFDWVSGGYPGSAMPAFKDTLTERQRWDVINFIRTLGK